jgi:hypothetical protein
MADSSDTYYAWSPIRYGGDKAEDEGSLGGAAAPNVQIVSVGDTVDAGTLGISDEDFQDLIDAGSVREMEPPKDIPDGMSAMQAVRQRALDAGHSVDTSGGTHMLNEVEQMEVARAAQLDVEDTEDVEEGEAEGEDLRLARMPILEDKDLSQPPEEEETSSTPPSTGTPASS